MRRAGVRTSEASGEYSAFCYLIPSLCDPSYVNTSRHRSLDLARLDPLCPQLRELTVGDSLISYKPELTTDSVTFPALRSLALKDISMEGDQGCWKRMVG